MKFNNLDPKAADTTSEVGMSEVLPVFEHEIQNAKLLIDRLPETIIGFSSPITDTLLYSSLLSDIRAEFDDEDDSFDDDGDDFDDDDDFGDDFGDDFDDDDFEDEDISFDDDIDDFDDDASEETWDDNF